ncbi:POU domain, class 6, transcription factor 1 isoform X3 [Cervus canadensis]|uniref:POU domain, class 6, transcription factor 1 isoform X3 n=1 Tax=Cervus canadensis TaxID=1574408 RepID=UPI001CA386BC|nr:POU domain, class 6, transcription factor 1 isoform X3 [Cervus canadensis]XP_043302173.1 POU domain, class 6, transcription factor 1 isoform X3 [Cervus canadensis]XP_043302174.1 POU domain, class 6, transcription factor 1 isoform X3 [Cervus canadensis]XP_043302175.1 POU domain, class 6, transcription factor 1 isoform X3 [Cervus canadensis]
MRPSEFWRLEWMPRSLLRRRAKRWRLWPLRAPRAEALLKLVKLLVKLAQTTQTPLWRQLTRLSWGPCCSRGKREQATGSLACSLPEGGPACSLYGVKSLPGMPLSPAPAVATFSQAPCQPQASQTLTPLAVQTAPQYCRSSGWSTGAGRVDNSYCNRGCPPRTDRCFSHGGNFQATFSRSPSSCCAEHRSPGTCTSRPTGPGLLARPAPTTGPAPDAVPAPATAADHTGHSTAAHCCHRHCPHPQVCGHPHTDHRSACRLRIQPGNRKLLPSPKAHRGWTGSLAKGEPDPCHGGVWRWRTSPLNAALFQHFGRDGLLPRQLSAHASQPRADNLCQEGWPNLPEPGPWTSLGGSVLPPSGDRPRSWAPSPQLRSLPTPFPACRGSAVRFSPTLRVIGTLPWVVNSASVAAPAPAQSLQVQAVTPQLLLNAQGQVIATLASSPLPPPVAVRKPSTPESPAKSEVQPIQPTPAMPQPAVVIASPAPAAKPAASAPIPITCSETPTVSQLVSKPHTPSLDEDGINLEEIREFAKNFKIRRLSLGLTQTQVGQALTATEGPAYSQSAICRFEKLDITPKSAQKLKPVLEKWLHEAELRNQEGQQNLMEFVGGEPSKKRKRRTSFTPQAIEALNAYFEKNPLPTGQEITEIAKELNYDREVVRVWFCNRRQTLKNTSKLNVFQIP